VELSNAQWALIDEQILACRVLQAIQAIRQECGVDLNQAKSIHFHRYQTLRANRQLEFKCSDDDYWSRLYG